MYRERRKENWTQTIRRENLEKVAAIIKDYGGYAKILHDMHDFERFLAYQMGCSIKTAREYIETVRGASLFMGKSLGSGAEESG